MGNKLFLCYKRFNFNNAILLSGIGNSDKLPSVIAAPKKTYHTNLSLHMRIKQ